MRAFFFLISFFVLCNLSAQIPKSGVVQNVILGETVADESWVYISSVDGKAYNAIGSNLTNYAHGLIYTGGSANDTTQVFLGGLNPWSSSALNPTNVYYLSTSSAGDMTDVKPKNVGYYQALCVAVTDSTIIINPLPVATNGLNGVYLMTGVSPQEAVVNVDNLVEPTSPTSSYTIDLPSANDGDFVTIVFNESITTVSVTSDVTIVGTAITTAVPGTVAGYKYFEAPDVWIRVK
jgi:hypothetical protein